MATKARGTTRKEKSIANDLLKKAFGCTTQSCGKVGACAILCDDLKCSTMSDKKMSSAQAAFAQRAPQGTKRAMRLWCPTQLICNKVQCGTVDCSSMKTK